MMQSLQNQNEYLGNNNQNLDMENLNSMMKNLNLENYSNPNNIFPINNNSNQIGNEGFDPFGQNLGNNNQINFNSY